MTARALATWRREYLAGFAAGARDFHAGIPAYELFVGIAVAPWRVGYRAAFRSAWGL